MREVIKSGIREVVTLYQLVETSYQEQTSSPAQTRCYHEPLGYREKIRGFFTKEATAKKRLDILVQQRVNEGYSEPRSIGDEQTKVEHRKGNREDTILCTSIDLEPIKVNRAEIKERESRLFYQGKLIE